MAGIEKRSKLSKISLYQTGLEVATVALQVAQNNHPPLRIRTSKWVEDFTNLKTKADPDGTKLVAEVRASFL
ncbi:hypothetical protein [Lacinutrix undariae]